MDSLIMYCLEHGLIINLADFILVVILFKFFTLKSKYRYISNKLDDMGESNRKLHLDDRDRVCDKLDQLESNLNLNLQLYLKKEEYNQSQKDFLKEIREILDKQLDSMKELINEKFKNISAYRTGKRGA